MMKNVRILNVFHTWNNRDMHERGFTALLAELASAGAESHVIYEEARGALPDTLAGAVRTAGLHSGTGEGNWAEILSGLISSVRPHAVWVHDDVHVRVTQRLDRADRSYGLWHWIHDLRMTCLTGLRAKSGERDVLCKKPLSIACFGEIESERCTDRLSRRERPYVFTDYLSRINLLLALRSVDYVIVQNEYLGEIIRLNCSDAASKLHIVPGILPPLHRRNRIFHRKNRRTVIFRGILAPEGGLHLAIQALSDVYADLPIHFRIFGKGDDEGYIDHCRTLAEISQRKNSTLTMQFEDDSGSVEDDGPYRNAEVLVVPGQWGAASTVSAAMAFMAGAAVVTTGAGALSSLIRQTSLLVGGEPRDLAEGIWTLLIDEDFRCSMVQKGVHLVKNHFSPKRQLEEIHSLVEGLDTAPLRPLAIH
jgi:glycosyltransferase involved in cell wall biosynthesis